MDVNYSNLLMDECPPDLQSPDDERDTSTSKKSSSTTRGVAMSFGFKRRQTAPSIASNAAAARRLASTEIIDRNGNRNGDTEREPLTSNSVPSGRTTPRLAPPKKEASATRVSRFGFRQPHANRLNKVADLNNTHPPAHTTEFSNNNHGKYRSENTSVNLLQPKIRTTTGTVIIDSNRNRPAKTGLQPIQATKFTLQTNQLPRPQFPLRVMESKTAKTLANNSRKISSGLSNSAESDSHSSSKEGSVTEDSGVGSHGGGNFETDTLQGVEILESSPSFGFRKCNNAKPRNLEVVVSGNTFDVRDLDDAPEPTVALPSLPSAFVSNPLHTGFVRERTIEYQRHIERERRKISVTSSEGFSDDYGEEEKTYRDNYKNEKNIIPKSTAHKTFLKSRLAPKDDSSPPSSDEWAAGEAMADELSCSLSSSDESKDKGQPPLPLKITQMTIGSALQNLINIPITNATLKPELKNVLLTIEDPRFAAVAAASNTGTLLEDETSPVDSLLCSYSDDVCKQKLHQSSSNSKDINEKLTLSNSSPGTPTNADNSLSLSDGKDYFDDEIADQPALVFDDTLTSCNSETFTLAHQKSESTPTLIETTPKLKRKVFGSIDGSPLPIRNRRFLNSRTGSVDTLSPCESIASDDLMMDFEYSQSSGVDEAVDRSEVQCNSLYNAPPDAKVRADVDVKRNDLLRDWSTLVGNYIEKGSPKSLTRSNRLLRSRAGTPNSVTSVPDSPRSLDSRINVKSRTSITQSPLRPPRTGSITSSAGYESDDSIKLERSNHGAMVQDIMSIKTMLLKLKRVLHESETHNPFDIQHSLANGLFNGLSSAATEDTVNEELSNTKIEIADLRRQVIFLQGQIEDRDKTIQSLQEQMTKIINDEYAAKSAPASTVCADTCNAATQTERLRPISAGSSLLQGSSPDGNVGSLVSASESTARKSRTHSLVDTSLPICSQSKKTTQPRLWRKPGEPPSPQRYSSSTSSIPRRANSRTRAPSIPS